MAKIPQKYLDMANKASIVDYAKQKGIELNQDSDDEFRGVDHDSMIITPKKNAWFWNSRNLGGVGALSFAQKYVYNPENLPSDSKYNKLSKADKFKFCVKDVLKANVPEFNKDVFKSEPFKLNNSQFADNEQKALNYLHNTRGISMSTLNEMLEDGALRQNKFGDALFMWQNPENKKEIKGISQQGTTINFKKYGKRGTLKRIEKNSTKGYGFNFDTPDCMQKGLPPQKIIFFEAPIDAMSYYDASRKVGRPVKNTRFIAMDGLKEEVFNKQVQILAKQDKDHNLELKGAALGVDNDEAGQKFASKIRGQFDKVKYNCPNKKFGKDWNDALRVIDKAIEHKRQIMHNAPKDKHPETTQKLQSKQEIKKEVPKPDIKEQKREAVNNIEKHPETNTKLQNKLNVNAKPKTPEQKQDVMRKLPKDEHPKTTQKLQKKQDLTGKASAQSKQDIKEQKHEVANKLPQDNHPKVANALQEKHSTHKITMRDELKNIQNFNYQQANKYYDLSDAHKPTDNLIIGKFLTHDKERNHYKEHKVNVKKVKNAMANHLTNMTDKNDDLKTIPEQVDKMFDMSNDKTILTRGKAFGPLMMISMLQQEDKEHQAKLEKEGEEERKQHEKEKEQNKEKGLDQDDEKKGQTQDDDD